MSEDGIYILLVSISSRISENGSLEIEREALGTSDHHKTPSPWPMVKTRVGDNKTDKAYAPDSLYC